MAELGRILIADDDETFRDSLAALLQRENYECVCAPDATTAIALLGEAAYDLLIADIKMPGNPNLELIHSLPAQGVQVILVTGHPSLRSAVDALQLPVVAYLVKPFELDELLAAVRPALTRARLSKTVHSVSQRLQEWQGELEHISQFTKTGPRYEAAVTLEAFLTLTLHNIARCLADLTHLTDTLPKQDSDTGAPPPPANAARAALPAGFHENVPLSRIRQLEQALHRIAHDLADAGITGGAVTSLVSPEAVEELRLLSSREGEILRSLLDGQRVPIIARSLYLSPHTVRNHLKSIFRKLDVRSQPELIEKFRRRPPEH